MTEDKAQNNILIYTSKDGDSRIDVRFEGEIVWLTQGQLDELFRESTVKKYLTVEKIKIGTSDFYIDGESGFPTNQYVRNLY